MSHTIALGDIPLYVVNMGIVVYIESIYKTTVPSCFRKLFRSFKQ